MDDHSFWPFGSSICVDSGGESKRCVRQDYNLRTLNNHYGYSV